MKYENTNINEYLKVISAAAGMPLAEVARRMDETPQGLNQKFKTGKLQKDIDYISRFAAACGYDFKWDFIKKE